MTIQRSLSKLETKDSEKADKNSVPLIPGLPDHIVELCLLHVPYPEQPLVRSVSSSWKRVITNPTFFITKNALSLSLPYVFVSAFHKSTARIQWQALDPRSGRWFVLPPMPECPPGFVCVSLPRQGKLFVLGGVGSDTESSTQSTIMYRSSTNQWSVLSPMLTPRSCFAAGSVNGKIITVGGGGTSSTRAITAVESYDPEGDTWTPVANMDTCLKRYDSAVVGNKMYVTEGWTWPVRFSPRGGVYDPDCDTWRDSSQAMREGWTGLSVVLGDRLFVISEYGDCPLKVYDPDCDTWRYVGGQKFPTGEMNKPLAVNGVDGKIYVVSFGLKVAIGKVGEVGNGDFKVEWEIVDGPEAFRDFSALNCQVLYG